MDSSKVEGSFEALPTNIKHGFNGKVDQRFYYNQSNEIVAFALVHLCTPEFCNNYNNSIMLGAERTQQQKLSLV